MAETVNPEDHKKDELVQMATDAGLTDAAKYPNKAVIADGINRVNAGENAADVNAELASSDSSEQIDQVKDAETALNGSGENLEAVDKEQRKNIYSINGGHPRKFDETGNPVYSPDEV